MRIPLHYALHDPPPHEAKLRRKDQFFAVSALRLAGLAGALLGWRPEEFWRATPAELGAVLGVLVPGEEARVSSDDLRRLMGMFPDG
jgi:hypothetical protein